MKKITRILMAIVIAVTWMQLADISSAAEATSPAKGEDAKETFAILLKMEKLFDRMITSDQSSLDLSRRFPDYTPMIAGQMMDDSILAGESLEKLIDESIIKGKKEKLIRDDIALLLKKYSIFDVRWHFYSNGTYKEFAKHKQERAKLFAEIRSDLER
jgi:hypothetical protein